jgi:hypothetical protein
MDISSHSGEFISHWDAILFPVYLAGQGLFILKLASMRMRSSMNTITSRWQYFYCNWDVSLVRVALSIPLFGLLQHSDAVSIAIHHPLPFVVPKGAIACLMAGYFSSSVLDWLSGLEKLPIVGWPVPAIIKDNIPLYPVNGNQVPVMDKTKVTT